MEVSKIIKDARNLFLITVVAGLLLGVVYEVTKAPRAKQEQLKIEQAYQKVFSDADAFEDVKMDEKKAASYIAEKGITESQAVVNDVVLAKAGGEDAGYIVTVTDKEGYGGDIKFTVGIQLDGTVTGVSILSIGETAGLGMKANEPAFLDQFAGKKVDAFAYTKTGKSKDNEIDAISGATITTKAMTNGTNAGIVYYKSLVEGGVISE